jgi:glycosyltransferase involved in cell wall biosynthesis
MKVALIHDWLIYMRGAERVLEALCELYPEADLYTLFHIPGAVSPTIENRRITTSVIQRLPRIQTWYRRYLPLFPLAIEGLDLRDYDLVISSSHSAAKGVITAPATCHISYIHTPMLYVWEQFHQYFGEAVRPFGLKSLLAHYLRMWDVLSAGRVDYLIANSRYTATRIWKRYRREAAVIHPPVNVERYNPSAQTDAYFLLVSALVPRKRIDLAIAAFNLLGLPLRIVGRGWTGEEKRLKALAHPNVEFLGWRSDRELAELYSRCRALVFPGEEDFGIVPLEAMASGRPVIAYGRGGVLDTVLPLNADGVGVECSRGSAPPTGVFFYQQTVEALVQGIRFFEAHEGAFDPDCTRAHSLRFGKEAFKGRIKQFIDAKYVDWTNHISGNEVSREAQRSLCHTPRQPV